MHVEWVFRGCNGSQKNEIQAYWDQKLPRLERLLAKFPDQLRDMQITLRHLPRIGRFENRAVVHLPTNTLVVEEAGESWTEALDTVTDTLVRRIKSHKEKLRGDWTYRRRRRRREEFDAAGPLLVQDRKMHRQEEFFALLRPLLKRLGHHARRELRLLELDGKVPMGAWTPRDVVDELLVRAWERFESQSSRITLEVWLMGLAQEILDEIAAGTFALSLETPLPQPEFGAEREEEEHDDFFTEHELPTLADTLPDRDSTTIWDMLDRDEQREALERALAQLAPLERQAFVQHELDGFDLDEIAVIQDRPKNAVVADIESAKAKLRATVGTSGQVASTYEK